VSAIVLVCVLATVAVSHREDLAQWGSSLQPPTSDSTLWQEEDYSTDPPTISRAATGTGVTVELSPEGKVPLTYTEIYEKNAPSMVSIQSESRHEYSTGTGIILSEDGYIITNAHVVAGAQSVQVSLQNNRVLQARLVGFDADEDLAVLKVEAEGLTPAEFGDSFALQCGDPVAALGDPLGYRCTITDGIVSALDREVEVDDVTMVLIQTSAAINFGNSGGALINQYGQVVGITTIKIVTDDGSAEGLGFAIPSQRVKYVVDNLIAGNEVRAGVFGFSVNRFPVDGGGLEIVSVDEQSDAWTQGIRQGDILLSANGMEVTGTQDLIRLKQCLGAGDVVELVYLRNGEIETAEVALIDAALVS
jgi:S1-C subfamily serine protease